LLLLASAWPERGELFRLAGQLDDQIIELAQVMYRIYAVGAYPLAAISDTQVQAFFFVLMIAEITSPIDAAPTRIFSVGSSLSTGMGMR
jgi:hypothetical protein